MANVKKSPNKGGRVAQDAKTGQFASVGTHSEHREAGSRSSATAKVVKTPVKGGWVVRNAKTGRFVSVGTDGEVHKKGPRSAATVKDVSKRRSEALKRLADR